MAEISRQLFAACYEISRPGPSYTEV